MAAQMQRMRNQIEQLQSELLFYRNDCNAPLDEFQVYNVNSHDVFQVPTCATILEY